MTKKVFDFFFVFRLSSVVLKSVNQQNQDALLKRKACFFLPARQISRLETRIKECIRVESMMVGKPKMRNESKWDGRGQVKRVLAHSAGPNFFEGSERN